MTVWVLSIDKDHPQHWEYAKRDKVWDLRTRRHIEAGDTIYFWQSQRSLVGRGVVARDVTDSPTSGLPWDDTETYQGRITFSHLEDYLGDEVKWSRLQELTGLKGTPNFAPRTDDPAVIDRLTQLFGRSEPLPEYDDALAILASEVESPAAPAEELAQDARERTLAEIAIRRGQPQFRAALLETYNRRCAVTGTADDAVLEAAHIMPYRGKQTNLVTNGLLLRSDIHTLFDRHLITVIHDGTDYVVRVAPDITDEGYRKYDGQPLAQTPPARTQPMVAYLQHHAIDCSWLNVKDAKLEFDQD